MNFLVILICLSINSLWLKDFDRFDDSWVFKFRQRIEQYASNLFSDSTLARSIGIIIIYTIPTMVLALLLLFATNSGYGIPTMIIHILVLLVAFDRTQPGRLASDFLAKWDDGDMEDWANYLRGKLASTESSESITTESLSNQFKKLLTYRCFEKIFVMFFWYMLAGPIAILLCYISYQIRDSYSVDQDETHVDLVPVIIELLEWVPMRLVAITFSLAGNFESCFKSVKETFWIFSSELDNADLVFNYANCALSRSASFDEDSDLDSKDDKARTKKAREISALQGLLERSQAIWLSVIALITIFGLRF